MTEVRTRPPEPTAPEDAGADRPHDEPRPATSPSAPARSITAGNGAAGMGGVRGTAPPEPGAAPGTVSPTGSGQDVRHRGWYWHWNTLITQYAPLLGLKGVGLLNSYTVWTDRREGSPHQGYAFPAQESEAHFYGEGREELITLNKLLVALDLIEIHKEMVLRQDARGRRWRVPHNFYRVKDPRDGLVLSLPAVVRVLELARRERNVFRHIRHIFGPQFAPIDRTSNWHILLPQLRALPLWEELAAQAARERRVPRKATQASDAATTDTPTVAAANDAAMEEQTTVPGTARDADDASTTSARRDEARISSTLLADSTVHHGDKATARSDNQPLSESGSPARTYAVAHGDAETALLASNGADVGANDAEIHSTNDEGTTNIEGASTSVVRPDDRMYYQEGESKEETTRTSSTSESTRTRARTRGEQRERERGRPLAPPDTETPETNGTFHEPSDAAADDDVSRVGAQSPRPAVSDLFTAMAERTSRSQREAEDWYHRANLTPAAAVWTHGRIGDAVDDPPPAGATTTATDATVTPAAASLPASAAPRDATDATATPFDPHDLPDPDTAPGQPLPPVPGDAGIVVRALDVRDSGAPDAAQAAQLAEIETALTMANGRPPSDMQLSLLWHVAQDCDVAARSGPGPGSGVGWVLAAIWEAANSSNGNFVAPKRVAAICDRWATEGFMTDGRATAPTPHVLHEPPPSLAAPARTPEQTPEQAPEPGREAEAEVNLSAAPPAPAPTDAEPEPDVSVPDEEGTRLWAGVLRRLDGVLHADALGSRTFTAARIAATAGERVTVQTPDGESAARLGSYRGLIARRLSDVLGRAVTDVRFMSKEDAPAPDAAPIPVPTPSPAPFAATGSGPLPVVASAPGADLAPVVPPTIPTFTVPGTSQTNSQLWAHALHTLRGVVSDATFKVWLQSTALIAADADGTLVVGARNRVQRERLERQHTGEIAAALGDLTGEPVAVRVAVVGTPEGGAR